MVCVRVLGWSLFFLAADFHFFMNGMGENAAKATLAMRSSGLTGSPGRPWSPGRPCFPC